MHVLYAAAFSAIASCGIYLLLSRHIARIILGLLLLSAAANTLIFLAGRIDSTDPPVIAPYESALSASAANPLPQAMILTAIVIGFALAAFAAALALRTFGALGTLDTRRIRYAEPPQDPSS